MRIELLAAAVRHDVRGLQEQQALLRRRREHPPAFAFLDDVLVIFLRLEAQQGQVESRAARCPPWRGSRPRCSPPWSGSARRRSQNSATAPVPHQTRTVRATVRRRWQADTLISCDECSEDSLDIVWRGRSLPAIWSLLRITFPGPMILRPVRISPVCRSASVAPPSSPWN